MGFHSGVCLLGRVMASAAYGFFAHEEGVVLSLADAGADAEWLRWIPAVSANARFALSLMLPSLFLKSLWYAGSQDDLLANFRSLVWGLEWHEFPRSGG